MNIVHIATRMKHHSLHSGYDRLSNYVPCKKSDGSWIFKGMGLVPDRLWGILLRKNNLFLVPEFKREIDLQVTACLRSKAVYHFLYGENDFRRFHPLGVHKLFVTYHFPPNKFSTCFSKPPYLGRVGALIVVGSNQIEYFSKWIPREKIIFIPHGIDTDYFTPAKREERKGKDVLFVGVHLRDFETLAKVIERVERLSLDISFTLITFEEYRYAFRKFKTVVMVNDITESKLLESYQSHTLLFLPLVDTTANNTLLEAAASGLPIITSDVGGVRDYFDDKSAILLKSKNIDLMVSTIVDLLHDEKKREELSLIGRKRMLGFDWKVISEEIKTVYKAY
jgi:glycosyltransferase involved in cell wall biosynthesis